MTPADLTPDEREEWEERAAIIEADGVPRAVAERLALERLTEKRTREGREEER
jgi:hypothetical protein